MHDPEGSLPVVDNEGDAVVAGHGVHAVGGWLYGRDRLCRLVQRNAGGESDGERGEDGGGPVRAAQPGAHLDSMAMVEGEVGRASCRERACKYVQLWAVDVYSTKI